jgi:C_GCAxxG_C_C family probable redox protein
MIQEKSPEERAMETNGVEQQAFHYFQSGFHCAEAISKAILEFHAGEQSADLPRIASGFGGGIGKSKEDVCGALSGGIIAIGYLYGRMNPYEDLQKVMEVSAEFRKRFIQEAGSTNCAVILRRFGEQEDMMKCKRMTMRAAKILSDLLKERQRDLKQ